jgi:ADP-L-glycero-D-manno-heptose 6-epimerase
MKNPKFIVTGGAGLIGNNLVAALNARGHEDILVVDNLNHPAKKANLERVSYQDYLDKAEFRKAIQANQIAPVMTLFHLGACSATTETDKTYLDSNNLGYTQELCEWSLANNVRFVYASSAATYGEGENGYVDDEATLEKLKPLNLYGQSKHDFDLWARAKGYFSKITGIKYFNVYGPGEDHKGEMRSVVNKAWHQIRETGKLQLFRSHRKEYADGCQQRDFLYVDDAVAITLFFHERPEVSGLFNAGTGTPHTWLELAHAIFAAMHKTPDISFIDIPEHIRDKYQYFTLADINKLRNAGYDKSFTPLQQAVSEYIHALEKRKLSCSE